MMDCLLDLADSLDFMRSFVFGFMIVICRWGLVRTPEMARLPSGKALQEKLVWSQRTLNSGRRSPSGAYLLCALAPISVISVTSSLL